MEERVLGWPEHLDSAGSQFNQGYLWNGVN